MIGDNNLPVYKKDENFNSDIHSRCLFLVALSVSEPNRTRFPLTRAKVRLYIEHACLQRMNSLKKLFIGNGCVLLLVEISESTALAEFVEDIKMLTSLWIIGSGTDYENYWEKAHIARPVSPEDDDIAAAYLGNLPAEMGYYDVERLIGKPTTTDGAHYKAMHCHHFVLFTSRYRLLLRTKYHLLLEQNINRICEELGAGRVVSASRRNHAHILCDIPESISPLQFIHDVWEKTLEWMHSNIHFRKFDGWSTTAIIYTVGSKRWSGEEYNLYHQSEIHVNYKGPNEMYYYYRRLNFVPFASFH